MHSDQTHNEISMHIKDYVSNCKTPCTARYDHGDIISGKILLQVMQSSDVEKNALTQLMINPASVFFQKWVRSFTHLLDSFLKYVFLIVLTNLMYYILADINNPKQVLSSSTNQQIKWTKNCHKNHFASCKYVRVIHRSLDLKSVVPHIN